MNEGDETFFALDEAAYRAGVEREVNEEIKIALVRRSNRRAPKRRLDGSGKRSPGNRARLKLAEPKVEKREAMITGLTFLTKKELMTRRESLEVGRRFAWTARPSAPVATALQRASASDIARRLQRR